jgi:hypothetical protein
MVHLSKLAVGIRDVSHLSRVQAQRIGIDGVLRHRTRMAPKRGAELLDGGSIYWVIAGAMLARQRLIGLEPAARDDGTPCVALRLDPALVPVMPRVVRAFQGWRYLEPSEAPADLTAAASAAGTESLPEALRRALVALALL